MTEEFYFPPTHDPGIFRDAGHALVDLLADYLEGVHRRDRVIRWREPQESLLEFLETAPVEGVPEGERAGALARLLGETFPQAAMHMHHPLYLGHQVAIPAAQAALADLAVSVLNPPQAVYEISPGANAIEAVVIRWLANLLGYDDSADGLVVSGGSVANLTALLAARNAFLGAEKAFHRGVSGEKLAVIVSKDHHYSIARAAMILGIGSQGIVEVPLDHRRRMNPDGVREAANRAVTLGRSPFVLCASSGSTPVGAFDPLPEIADAAEQLGLWFHVDAAHGGSAALSESQGCRLHGVERADSVVWDPHKLLFMPAAMGTVLFRDGQKLIGAFHQEAPYLFDAHHPELTQFDIGKKSIACTQRADCVKLWACVKVFGTRLFGELYDHCCNVARALFELLSESPDFETIHEPECNILCFRHVPTVLRDADRETVDRHNAELRAAVVRDGRAYLTPGHLDGRDVLRTVIMNPMIREEHLERFLEIIREVAYR